MIPQPVLTFDISATNPRACANGFQEQGHRSFKIRQPFITGVPLNFLEHCAECHKEIYAQWMKENEKKFGNLEDIIQELRLR